MTLPAHRFSEDRKKGGAGAKVWTFDFDETITTAPKRLARLATALRKLGDRVVVITGNQSPRDELVKRLEDYGFPFDDLIQYEDLGTDGVQRSHVLEQVDAWCGIDNRADRAYTYAKVCPHLYLIAKPPDDDTDDASKKKAKKVVKQQTRSEERSEERSAAPPPPNLRESSDEESQPEHECGTCRMYDLASGTCWGYANLPVDGEWVCDSWSLDPNWQQQDAAQDADDGELNEP